MLDRAGPIEFQAERLVRPVAAGRIVENRGTVVNVCPGPVPASEAIFKRFVAGIHVKVAGTAPVQSGPLKPDLDPRTRRDRPPGVAILGVENEVSVGNHFRYQSDPADDPARQRVSEFA